MSGATQTLVSMVPFAVLPLLFLDRRLGGRPASDQDELGINLTLGAITLLSDAAILGGFLLLYTAIAPHLALIAPLSFPLQLAIAIVAGDFLSYWHHRLLHRLPWLWASHVVHHQSRSIDLGTGLRNHPFGTITAGLFWSPLLLAGIAPSVMILAVGLIGTWVVLIHRRETGWYPRFPAPLPLLLNLPAHHRLHHHEGWPAGDCNYGLLLIVWDRLFGTYREPDGEATAFGVPGARAIGPIGELLWDEWRDVLGLARSVPDGKGRTGTAAGLASYVIAAALIALAAAVATAPSG